MKKVEKIIDVLMEKSIEIQDFLTVFLGIIFLRVFEEQFLAKAVSISFWGATIEFIHNLFFFLIAFLLLWIFLSLILKVNPQKLANIFLWASLLILLPPVIDMAKTRGEVFWSFYVLEGPVDLLREFVTVFGRLPSGIVYFGTKITFVIAIFFVSGLIFLKTKNIFKTMIGILGSYAILFFMGSFPSIFVYGYRILWSREKLADTKSFEIAQFFGTPGKVFGVETPGIFYTFPFKLELIFFPFLVSLLAILFFMISREKFRAVLANFRYPQIVYHGGLFFVGLGLGFLKFSENLSLDIFSLFTVLTLLLSIVLAWKASVVFNDIWDLPIDRISNPNRPLPKNIFEIENYRQFGFLCFLLSVLGGLVVGFKFAVLLLAYQIIAWFYSGSLLRLKKFPGIATFVSSLASVFILFLGYILISQDQSVNSLSWRIILLLVISYTISIPIKDLKDIEGDGKYGIWTIPVLLGEEKGRLLIAINVFISFVLSVFFLNEFKLFWWAIIFGIASFFVVISKKIKPTRIFWWILGTVSLYLLVLVKIVFIDNIDSLIK